MHIFYKLLLSAQRRILRKTSVAVLTSQYLRQVGLAQAIPIGTGYAHSCHALLRPIEPGKVRFGFIPEEWFEFFYSKTGVTGPYMFGIGLTNYLFSKEIYVCEHNFYSGLSLAILCVAVVKKLGPRVANYADKQIEIFEQKWQNDRDDEFKELQKLIADEELEQWRAEGNNMLMEVKKENIALQVEAAYREALMKIHGEVKHCLDYQVACYRVEQRIKQKHRVHWLVKNVHEQLPKNLDAKELEKVKRDVSALALTLKADI